MAIITLYTEKPSKPAKPAKKPPRSTAKKAVKPPRRADEKEFSDAERIDAVKLVLFKGLGYPEAAERYGCSVDSLRRWIAELRDRVVSENPKMKVVNDVKPEPVYLNRRRYTEQEQIDAVKLVLYEGYSQIDAAKRIGCEKSSLHMWILLHKDEIIANNPDRPVKYSSNFKADDDEGRIRTVEMILYEGVSVKEAAERMNCGKTSINVWLKEYAETVKKRNPRRKLNDGRKTHKRYAAGQRKQILERILYDGEFHEDMAREYGCSLNTITVWLQRYRDEIIAENPGRPLYDRSLLVGVPREERIRAVEMLLYSGLTPSQVAKKFGRGTSSILKWEKRYRDEIIAKYPDRKVVYQRISTGSYPVKERINAAKLVIFGGKSVQEVADKFGYPSATVRVWIRNYYDKLVEANPGLEVKYKHALAPPPLTEEERLMVVKRALFEDGIRRADLASEYGVSLMTINRWVTRYRKRVKAENPDLTPAKPIHWRKRRALAEEDPDRAEPVSGKEAEKETAAEKKQKQPPKKARNLKQPSSKPKPTAPKPKQKKQLKKKTAKPASEKWETDSSTDIWSDILFRNLDDFFDGH